jgi:hypothetical protein
MKPPTRSEKLLESATQQAGFFLVHPALIEFMGDLGAGVLLGRLLYWRDRSNDPEKWVYKSNPEWQAETCMGRHAIEQGAKVLIARGYVETEKRYVARSFRTHYRLRMDVLEKEFAAWRDAPKPEATQPDEVHTQKSADAHAEISRCTC